VISLDKTLILQMINFLILLLILNHFFFKPILDMLQQRRGRIQESEKRVSELEAEAAQQWEAYQRQLQEAKIEANAEKERIREEGIEAERKLLEDVRAETQQIVEEARRGIEEEAAKARQFLQSQAEGIALEMAEKILGRGLR
jgi:F-type H+-transporting ATPase subunit b